MNIGTRKFTWGYTLLMCGGLLMWVGTSANPTWLCFTLLILGAASFLYGFVKLENSTK